MRTPARLAPQFSATVLAIASLILGAGAAAAVDSTPTTCRLNTLPSNLQTGVGLFIGLDVIPTGVNEGDWRSEWPRGSATVAATDLSGLIVTDSGQTNTYGDFGANIDTSRLLGSVHVHASFTDPTGQYADCSADAPSPVLIQSPTTTTATLLDGGTPQPGDPFRLRVVVAPKATAAVNHEGTLKLAIDGVSPAGASDYAVDDDGDQTLTVPAAFTAGLKAGPHTLRVDYAGLQRLLPSQATTTLTLAAKKTHTDLAGGVTRVSGQDRVSTSVAATDLAFPEPTNAVVLASSTSYADSLAGGRLASAVGGPLLLSPPDRLDAAVGGQIDRLLRGADAKVLLLGGPAVWSDAAVAQLRALGHPVERVYGTDRFGTAAAIADRASSSGTGPIYLASGTNYPDGLAVAALAARTGGLILLTDGARMPDATARYLAASSERPVVAVGGPADAAASAATVQHTSIVGGDRYDTAARVADHFPAGSPTVGLASGENWPDALVGAAVMGHLGSPLLLTPSDRLDPASGAAATRLGLNTGLDRAYVFGGEKAVAPSIQDAFKAALSAGPGSL